MKVLIVTPGILPVPAVKGGAVENLVQMLVEKNEVNESNEFDIISIFDENAYKESQKYQKSKFIYIHCNKIKKIIRSIINKNSWKYFGNEYINEALKKIDFSQYDQIIIENCPQYIFSIRNRFSGKIILHLHNDRLNNNTKFALEILKRYDEVWCISKYIAERVAEINLKTSSKIKILYNGIDTKSFSILNENDTINFWKEKLNIKENEKIILYTGRITSEKGVKEIIKAFLEINNPIYKLIISGGVSKSIKNLVYYNSLKKLAKKNKNIIFTGYIDYNKLSELYNIADLGVIPSLWDEPFALTVIEHLASGHPIIATNSGGIPEIVNETSAILISKNNIVNGLKENIIKILENKISFQKERIIEQAYKFDVTNYYGDFEKLLNKQEKK